MTPPDNPHDRFFKETFSRLDVFADFAEAFMPADLFAGLDLTTLVRETDSFIDNDLTEHFADLVFSIQLAGSPVTVALLLEHKSYPVPRPHFQLNRYMLQYWQHQEKEKQPLRPVIPIVVYHGQTRWDQRPMSAYFDQLGPTQQFLPAFEYLLIDLSVVNHPALALLKSGYAQLTAGLLQNIRNKKRLTSLFQQYANLIQQLIDSEDGLRFVQTVFIYMNWSPVLKKVDVIAIFEQVSTYAKKLVMLPIDEWKLEGRLEGRQEGVLLGRQQGMQQTTIRVVKSMLKLNMDAQTIAAVTEQSLEQINQLIRDIGAGNI